jgi:plasmid stabilization system protein ParE
MTYKIVVSPRAQKEIENAIDFYALNSVDAPLKFITALNDAYETIKISPFFRVSYKNIRSLTINTFPTALFFVVQEEQHTVRILACFHHSRNPGNRPFGEDEI